MSAPAAPARRAQRGQSMTEFVIAMAIFLPLILGIIYIGKYSDIKHQAIQASRYAAMERALDPSGTQESDAVLVELTRARFFENGLDNNAQKGVLKNPDTTAKLATAGTLNPLWTQPNGATMLAKYGDVAVTLGSSDLSSVALAPMKPAQALLTGLDNKGQIQANVEVAIANATGFAPLSALNLKVAATTVIAGDTWNAGGAANVAGHLGPLAVPGKAISVLDKIPFIDVVFEWLADTPAPQFGCVRPDVVPAATARGATYSTSDPCY